MATFTESLRSSMQQLGDAAAARQAEEQTRMIREQSLQDFASRLGIPTGENLTYVHCLIEDGKWTFETSEDWVLLRVVMDGRIFSLECAELSTVSETMQRSLQQWIEYLRYLGVYENQLIELANEARAFTTEYGTVDTEIGEVSLFFLLGIEPTGALGRAIEAGRVDFTVEEREHEVVVLCDMGGELTVRKSLRVESAEDKARVLAQLQELCDEYEEERPTEH